MTMDKHILITADNATKIEIKPLENGVRYIILSRPQAQIIMNALALVDTGSEMEISMYREMSKTMEDFIEQGWA